MSTRATSVDPSRIIVVVLVIVLVAGGVVGFFAAFERYETTERTGVSGEARRDSFLATKRLLERMGRSSAELARADFETELEATGGGTLIVTTRGQPVTGSRLDAIDRWVRRGGHLVIAGPAAAFDEEEAEESTNPDRPRSLFEWAGVRPSWSTPEEQADDEEDFREALMSLKVNAFELPVAFRTWMRLDAPDSARVLAADRAGACAVELPRGRGTVVVLCSARAFVNRNIGDHSHATAIWALVSRSGGARQVLWSRDTDLPPLHQWLYARAPEAVLAFSLALVLWMFSRTLRAGRLADVAAPARRRTMEHIEASGRFAWRHNGGDALIGAMRNAFAARLERRQPAWAGATLEVRLAKLAEASGIEARALYRALEAPITERAEFIEAVRHLGILWRTV